MKSLRLVLSLAVIGLATLVVTSAADAQASRTWVSGVGDDVNPCSRTAPCKTFAGAISKTAAGGEINVLDAGGFGAVTITKSITIDGGGSFASILASLTNGVIINAAATDKVILRNLSINGFNNGINGIRILSAREVIIENVQIFGFNSNATTSRAIDINKTAAGEVYVRNSSLSNSANGIRCATTAGVVLVTVDRTTVENHGIVGTAGSGHAVEMAAGDCRATITRSTISGNNADGVRVSVGGNAVANVDSSTLTFNNATAVNAAVSGARIRLANNTITNNTVGIAIAGGATVESTGNNRVAGNPTNTPPNAVYPVQ